MIKSLIAMLAQSSYVLAFGQSSCREFAPEMHVQNFELDKFMGNWFPSWVSRSSPYVNGYCPIFYFSRYEPSCPMLQKRLKKFVNPVYDPYILQTNNKGMAMITDHNRIYKGLFHKGKSEGHFWQGMSLKPIKWFHDNFHILSTDYENYAIIYQCNPNSMIYNQDIITVLTRDSDIKLLESGTEEKIKEEFKRLFGRPGDNHTDESDQILVDLSGEENQSLLNETNNSKVGPTKLLHNSSENETIPRIKLTNEFENEEPEEQNNKKNIKQRKGLGNNFGRQKDSRLDHKAALTFGSSMRRVDHDICDKSVDYPDLSMSLRERLRIKELEDEQGILLNP